MLSSDVLVDLAVERPAVGGRMIARHDGQVVLVSGAIPGERVRARVERIARGAVYASVAEILDASSDRRAVKGEWGCGGNVYGHIAYERQVALKAEILGDAFRRIGRMALPRSVEVVPSPERGYRMRARLHVRGRRLGFFREGTHDLCDAAPSDQLLPETIEVLNRVAERLNGVTGIEVAENMAADERVLHFEVGEQSAGIVQALRSLWGVPGLTGLSCGGPEGTRVMRLGGTVTVADPLAVFVPAADHVSGHRLRRHVRAFFQGNRYLLPTLVERVLASTPNGSAVDLYSGVGLLAVSLAAAGRAPIVAVEGDGTNIRDLVDNASPFRESLRVAHASVEEYLRHADALAETVIVDPPRTGLSREAMSSITGRKPGRIVYVSCDPPTLARDARAMIDAGYEIEGVEAFDLFPNTAHVESLAVLVRS